MHMDIHINRKKSNINKTLLVLPAAVLGLAALTAPMPVSAAEQGVHVQPVEIQTAQQADGQTAAAESAESQKTTQGQTAQPVKKMKRVQALQDAKEAKAAETGTAEVKHADGNIEVQLEYLDGRFFEKRNVDLYNVHVYKQYRQLGALSLHYGLTFERALGYTTEDDIYRDAEAVGFGPSYMLRWTKHVSGKLDASLDATGSVLAYNHAHPGNGRAFGFLWRIGPRLTYNYTDRDALSLAYLFHHSSNGFSTHNPGYNGVGFSLGFTHWY
ncbi:MAG: Acyloxyacyl hydrolase [Mitsuokella multacida]|jgi:hypothetical protein